MQATRERGGALCRKPAMLKTTEGSNEAEIWRRKLVNRINCAAQSSSLFALGGEGWVAGKKNCELEYGDRE